MPPVPFNLQVEIRPGVSMPAALDYLLKDDAALLTELGRKASALALEHWKERGVAVPDPAGEVHLLLTGDEEIRELNRQFRGIDRPTDVLSFPLWEPGSEPWNLPGEQEPEPLGDIVISVETAARQAEEYGHSLQREVAFLFVHGLLHLWGFDHQTEEQREEMRALEEAALSSLGLVR